MLSAALLSISSIGLKALLRLWSSLTQGVNADWPFGCWSQFRSSGFRDAIAMPAVCVELVACCLESALASGPESGINPGCGVPPSCFTEVSTEIIRPSGSAAVGRFEAGTDDPAISCANFNRSSVLIGFVSVPFGGADTGVDLINSLRTSASEARLYLSLSSRASVVDRSCCKIKQLR